MVKTKCGKILNVGEVTLWEDGYRYSHAYQVGGQYHESSLGIHEEPKPKKLYAYRHNQEIKFFADETLIMLSHRAHEFDIEYPLSKVDQNRPEH